MLVKEYEEEFLNYPYYVAKKRLLLYVPPILLVLGTFGNLFSFLILTKNIKKVSIYSYLSVLSLMDLSVLYIGLLRLWIGQFNEDIQNLSDGLCKAVVFLGYVSSDISVWLILAVTVDRFIVVYFPFQAPTLCKVKQARLVIAIIFVVFILLNVHFLWSVSLIKTVVFNETIIKCDPTPSYEYLVLTIWPWVDAMIYSFVPFQVIIVLNCLIIRQIRRARRARSQMQQSSISKPPGILNKSRRRNSRTEMNRKLTVMLLTVSFSFLLTTLPMSLTLIFTMTIWSDPATDEEFVKIHFVKTVTELLMYTNHTINFFLYCAAGRKFREQFQGIMCYFCSGDFLSRFRGRSRRYTGSLRLYQYHSSSGPRTLCVDCENGPPKGSVL